MKYIVKINKHMSGKIRYLRYRHSNYYPSYWSGTLNIDSAFKFDSKQDAAKAGKQYYSRLRWNRNHNLSEYERRLKLEKYMTHLEDLTIEEVY